MNERRMLKEEAKEIVNANRGTILKVLFAGILISFVIGCILGAIEAVISTAVTAPDYTAMEESEDVEEALKIGENIRLKQKIVDIIVRIVSLVITTYFLYGIFVSLVEIKSIGYIPTFRYLFSGFKKFWRILGRNLHVFLVGILVLILEAMVLGAVQALVIDLPISFPIYKLIMILLYAIVIIVYIYFLLKYAMSDYLLYLKPEISGIQAAKMSKIIMNRKRLSKYIGLNLSFILWYLLYFTIGFIGLCIYSYGTMQQEMLVTASGILVMVIISIIYMVHLNPYVRMTNIGFFDKIIDEEKLEEDPGQ